VTKVNGDTFIKEYTKGKLLGKGGFAKCYEFINKETNKIMASKIIPKATLVKSRSR
jgi:serine/threonine protein kinase